MNEVIAIVERWKASLLPSVNLGSVLQRSATAHKWRSTYRSLVIREATLWRMTDLSEQIVLLSNNGHYLGARILLRSALETLAILVYLNLKTQNLMEGKMTYAEYDECTSKMIMGSRNESTSLSSVNILTALKHAEKVYEGLDGIHARLSESAHPNYDGVLYGYTKTDWDEHETHFQNNWSSYFGGEQEPATLIVLTAFEMEYNDTWKETWEKFEAWLIENDARLESERETSNN